MNLRGVIFDMDGTLVDSRLDFDAIRADLGLSSGTPILEALNSMPSGEAKDRSLAILRQHEMRGVERSRLMPGAGDFLKELVQREIATGILTRNSRFSAEAVLAQLDLEFSQVMTRDEVPPKPDPTGLLEICRHWNVLVEEVLFIGDFLFDIQAGHNAGMRTVLYAPRDLPEYAHLADFTIQHFSEAIALIADLAKPG